MDMESVGVVGSVHQRFTSAHGSPRHRVVEHHLMGAVLLHNHEEIADDDSDSRALRDAVPRAPTRVMTTSYTCVTSPVVENHRYM